MANTDKYSFGNCKYCKKFTAIKNNVCKDCEEKIYNNFKRLFSRLPSPETFEELLRGFRC